MIHLAFNQIDYRCRQWLALKDLFPESLSYGSFHRFLLNVGQFVNGQDLRIRFFSGRLYL